MPITVSTNQNISALAGVTQSDVAHATVADAIEVTVNAVLTLDKSLFCQRLLIYGTSTTNATLIAGSGNTDGSFASAKEIYINPASIENDYFGVYPPLDLTGYFTLENVDIIAGSNIASDRQTAFIGQYPTPIQALTGGANRVFKNVRIRSVNRNGVHALIPQATIDGLLMDRLDFIFIEANPISAKNIAVQNSSWGIGAYDKPLIELSSSIVTRVFIQCNAFNNTQLKLTDVAVTERYMFRVTNNQASYPHGYTLMSSLTIKNGTPLALFSVFNASRNLLLNQAANSSGNTISQVIEYAKFTQDSLLLTTFNGTAYNPDSTANFVTSATITSYQTTDTSKFTFLILPLQVVHHGYTFVGAKQTIASIDTSLAANTQGLSFSPKLLNDTNVTLTQANAAALTQVATLNDIYDVVKVWNTTPVNAWYPVNETQVLSAIEGTLILGTKSLTINPSASVVSDVNTSTNLITVKGTNVTKTTKFTTIKFGGTLRILSTFNFLVESDATGVLIIPPGTANLSGSIFAVGSTINVTSGSAVVTVDFDQIANITPGIGVSIISAPVNFSGLPTAANANGYTPQSVLGIKNQRTSVMTTYDASSGSVSVSLSTLGIAGDFFTIVADARGYYRSPLVTNIPITYAGTFDCTNLFKAILDSDGLPICGLGISVEMAKLAYNQSIGTFEVDGGGVSFVSVVQKVDEITSTQAGLTQFDTNILRQLTSERNPYASTIYLPPPLKIQANSTTVTSPVFTDFIIVVVGDATGDPYTHSARPEIRVSSTKIIVDASAIANVALIPALL